MKFKDGMKVKAMNNHFTFIGDYLEEGSLYTEYEVKRCFEESIQVGDILVYNEEGDFWLNTRNKNDFSFGEEFIEYYFEVIEDGVN